MRKWSHVAFKNLDCNPRNIQWWDCYLNLFPLAAKSSDVCAQLDWLRLSKEKRQAKFGGQTSRGTVWRWAFELYASGWAPVLLQRAGQEDWSLSGLRLRRQEGHSHLQDSLQWQITEFLYKSHSVAFIEHLLWARHAPTGAGVQMWQDGYRLCPQGAHSPVGRADIKERIYM